VEPDSIATTRPEVSRGPKGTGLAIFCELLAGSLTGGFASNPDSPTAKRLVNNMLTIAIDPVSLPGREFFAADL
jgi:uncharacterized oxidoreductase